MSKLVSQDVTTILPGLTQRYQLLSSCGVKRAVIRWLWRINREIRTRPCFRLLSCVPQRSGGVRALTMQLAESPTFRQNPPSPPYRNKPPMALRYLGQLTVSWFELAIHCAVSATVTFTCIITEKWIDIIAVSHFKGTESWFWSS
jgi:hypothetical protein